MQRKDLINRHKYMLRMKEDEDVSNKLNENRSYWRAMRTEPKKIEKYQLGEQMLSSTVGLRADERLEEIARMLAGDEITEAARSAAAQLLKGGR